LEICGEAANVPQALELVESTDPDLVIVDISLEDDDGFQLIERIRSMYPKVKMLVSSMHDETIYAPRALRAGAHGYINKRESVEMVVHAARLVLQGEVYLSPQVARRLLHQSTAGEPLDDPTTSLTNREFVVFEMIGQGLNTREISRKLGLSPKTIETHRRSIKAKLHLQDGLQLRRHAVFWVKDNP
jgi:DNA-binding NarL/FixJ family response regulator